MHGWLPVHASRVPGSVLGALVDFANSSLGESSVKIYCRQGRVLIVACVYECMQDRTQSRVDKGEKYTSIFYISDSTVLAKNVNSPPIMVLVFLRLK